MALRVSVRFEIFKRDSFTCRYCGKKSPEAILEVDHILPVSGGGTDEFGNLVTACYECNRGKGARLLTEIPPESDLHEKAIVLAEQERQLLELKHWRMKQRHRESEELVHLHDMWLADYGDNHWKHSRVRSFLRTIGYADVLEILEYVIEHAEPWGARSLELAAWILFCSMCTKKVTNRDLAHAKQNHS